MKSLVYSAEVLIVRVSLATMLAVLLSLLFLGGGLNSTPAAQADGCPNNNFAAFYTRAGGNNYFYVNSYYDCNGLSGSDNTTYVAATGSAGYINANTDTWLTNSPSTSGTRYGETGRSGVNGYPTDGNYRGVQQAATTHFFTVEWGCMWYDLPDYLISHDYNCADMT